MLPERSSLDARRAAARVPMQLRTSRRTAPVLWCIDNVGPDLCPCFATLGRSHTLSIVSSHLEGSAHCLRFLINIVGFQASPTPKPFSAFSRRNVENPSSRKHLPQPPSVSRRHDPSGATHASSVSTYYPIYSLTTRLQVADWPPLQLPWRRS